MWTLCKELKGNQSLNKEDCCLPYGDVMGVYFCGTRSRLDRRDCYAPAGSDTGSLTLISSPSGLRFEAVIDPSCRRMASWAIASPSPLPSLCLSHPLMRKKGRKIFCKASFGTPGPSSHTLRMTAGLAAALSIPRTTFTSVPGRVKRIALRTMFSHALRSARESAFSKTTGFADSRLTDLPKDLASKSPSATTS